MDPALVFFVSVCGAWTYTSGNHRGKPTSLAYSDQRWEVFSQLSLQEQNIIYEIYSQQDQALQKKATSASSGEMNKNRKSSQINLYSELFAAPWPHQCTHSLDSLNIKKQCSTKSIARQSGCVGLNSGFTSQLCDLG